MEQMHRCERCSAKFCVLTGIHECKRKRAFTKHPVRILAFPWVTSRFLTYPHGTEYWGTGRGRHPGRHSSFRVKQRNLGRYWYPDRLRETFWQIMGPWAARSVLLLSLPTSPPRNPSIDWGNGKLTETTLMVTPAGGTCADSHCLPHSAVSSGSVFKSKTIAVDKVQSPIFR